MSDFSIDTILSKGADRSASNRLAHPCQPFLLHSADGLVPSHCSVSYICLYLDPACVPAAGAVTGEGFYFGHSVGSCCPQPQHHYCPGQAALGILNPAPMGQMRLHSLAQKGKRRRRHRTVFTQQQLEYLENLFNTSSYPDSSTREKLARKTHLSEETIKVCSFQSKDICKQKPNG
ncbi:homeobox protein goosecoid-like [Hypanus sabinus]|uniref:homeobox protein goosecoid-like n=1 Tax=Hypanus sabinus TaxID=79690 RepID=UPI0028C49B5E|nr:homeobox protein goosecoid-like [Hypanus sabinus]